MISTYLFFVCVEVLQGASMPLRRVRGVVLQGATLPLRGHDATRFARRQG